MTARLADFRIEKFPATRIIGRKICCKCGHPDENPIGAFWGRCFQDGTVQKLQAYPAIREPVPAFGFVGNFDHGAGTFDYIVAALTPADAQPFEGALSVELPALRYGIGTIEGPVPDIFIDASSLVMAEIEKQGLRHSAEWDFALEAYDHRFRHDAATTIIEYWVPLGE